MGQRSGNVSTPRSVAHGGLPCGTRGEMHLRWVAVGFVGSRFFYGDGHDLFGSGAARPTRGTDRLVRGIRRGHSEAPGQPACRGTCNGEEVTNSPIDWLTYFDDRGIAGSPNDSSASWVSGIVRTPACLWARRLCCPLWQAAFRSDRGPQNLGCLKAHRLASLGHHGFADCRVHALAGLGP
jgi:hypothetical protein